MVVPNTHWDREFRRSFEKTRHSLLDMLDTTVDILANDPTYKSFLMDGHTIMIDDYLEMRPERTAQVKDLIACGRLRIGPYYTLAEEFSISEEALVRNLIYGRKSMDKYGAQPTEVAYTPSSWGQTGQYPQILTDFGLKYMMFYRGISHHETDAEYVWSAPDGTKMLATRYALFCRYNFYYQVYRGVTRGRVFDKDYVWGQSNDGAVRIADGHTMTDESFDVKTPEINYDPSNLAKLIDDMVEREGRHFTTDIFLAMHGHDISSAHPLDAKIVADAAKALAGKYTIELTDLDHYWNEMVKQLKPEELPVLTGERRAYLKQGMWTYLFPNTISTRTYLKQKDFAASMELTSIAEPLASLAQSLGAPYPTRYADRAWRYLLSCHTHDANGGCAPDPVCLDMEYRYRKVSDIADLMTGDAIGHIVTNLTPEGTHPDGVQLIVFNPLPFERDAIVKLDLEAPFAKAKSVTISASGDTSVEMQPVMNEKSSVFVDSKWEVPSILETSKVVLHAKFSKLPALGYRAYQLTANTDELRVSKSLVRQPNVLENDLLRVTVNTNGTIDLYDKRTSRNAVALNFLTDEGESGNAWEHVSPTFDRKYNSLSVSARVSIVESGPLTSTIRAEYDFEVPAEYSDHGRGRSDVRATLPVSVEYTLTQNSPVVKVKLTVDNVAKDHWLRANFATGITATVSAADSHFDVVERPIALPDSTGWVEPARGTHPLRTFVDISDGKHGMALITKGIYEYEAFEGGDGLLALTLIRACRIKLKVSEEKITELDDKGVQCPGVQVFEYCLVPHNGGYASAGLSNVAADYITPVRAVEASRGKGSLPLEGSLLAVDNLRVRVTAVKKAEIGDDLIVRLFNPTKQSESATVKFGFQPANVSLAKMDESVVEDLAVVNETATVILPPKKIVTLRITQ
jgi:mannosylglycerate hydrolase